MPTIRLPKPQNRRMEFFEEGGLTAPSSPSCRPAGKARDGLVFRNNGKAIGVGALRSAWRRATKRAGLDGRRLHDLRRTRARELRRYLAESDIMELCGWETREMFGRYAIEDERHLEEAVGKAFGTLTAHPMPSGAPSNTRD